MKFDFDPEELRPLVAAVVNETLDRLEADHAKVNGRLAFWEPEAAALLGIERHALRDARRRGEIRGSRIGKRVVYLADDLRGLMDKNQIT